MRCLLLNPEFRSDSFWNYRETCHLRGARYPAAPLGLITVAAMLPQDWNIRLFDRNVQDWDPSVLDWADFVLMGGMMPQQPDTVELIHAAKTRGKPWWSAGLTRPTVRIFTLRPTILSSARRK